MALSLTFNPFSGKFDYIDLPSGTTNEIAYFSASNTVSSLTVATYPSLTELSYVKGTTSAIQTQLNNIDEWADFNYVQRIINR